jgi:hypothetical protein
VLLKDRLAPLDRAQGPSSVSVSRLEADEAPRRFVHEYGDALGVAHNGTHQRKLRTVRPGRRRWRSIRRDRWWTRNRQRRRTSRGLENRPLADGRQQCNGDSPQWISTGFTQDRMLRSCVARNADAVVEHRSRRGKRRLRVSGAQARNGRDKPETEGGILKGQVAPGHNSTLLARDDFRSKHIQLCWLVMPGIRVQLQLARAQATVPAIASFSGTEGKMWMAGTSGAKTALRASCRP